jgi:hypothetical protein
MKTLRNPLNLDSQFNGTLVAVRRTVDNIYCPVKCCSGQLLFEVHSLLLSKLIAVCAWLDYFDAKPLSEWRGRHRSGEASFLWHSSSLLPCLHNHIEMVCF